MTLTKLKPTLLVAELTGVSDSFESKTVKVWIDTLATHLTNWIVWFSKETMKATMLSCLERYPNTALILECAERIMQKASNVKSEGECCTNYKSHNTAYRVYIAASGLIVLISRAYGGHASDKFIVQDSGVLTRLVPGSWWRAPPCVFHNHTRSLSVSNETMSVKRQKQASAPIASATT